MLQPLDELPPIAEQPIVICDRCSNSMTAVAHFDDECPHDTGKHPMFSPKRIVIHRDRLDHQLRRLLEKLPRTAQFGVQIRGTAIGDDWGAFVVGVPQPIEVWGCRTEKEAWDGLIVEIMRRALVPREGVGSHG